MRIDLDWALTCDRVPDLAVTACVPGNAQLDYAKSQGWDDRWWYAEEFRRYRELEDYEWIYLARLPSGGPWSFHAKGLDYSGVVTLDGVEVGRFEGPFSQHVFRLPRTRGGERLQVRFDPAPTLTDDRIARKANRATTKPGMFYGWDFAPRIVPIGIWDEAWIEEAVGLQSVGIRSSLKGDLMAARTGSLQIDLSLASDADIWVRVLDPDGGQVGEWRGIRKLGDADPILVQVPNPDLWWPRTHGGQPLYSVEIDDGHRTISRRIGFRRVRLVPYCGAWDRPLPWPKSQNDPPITLEVNGVNIFGQGVNWVPPSIFPGTDTAEVYRPLLELAAESNFNLLRIWGGGGVPKDSFFDLCDEMGLMVWQEFPLACAQYVDDDDFLTHLRTEAECIVKRLRSHPCIAMYCGGNELFNSWSRNTEQSLALRTLNMVGLNEAPDTPFLMTSPVMGMAHGNYTFRDERGREPHQIFAAADGTAYTEFGCGSPASADQIRRIMPEGETFPPQPQTNWEWHCGLRAWDGNPGSWLCPDILEHYFGPANSLEELVEQGQWLQAEAMRFIYEEARRQQPRCSMALAWCFNEPWPTAANNSLVSWPCLPKPALDAVRQALAPISVSVRAPKFAWAPGETFEAEIWGVNNGTSPAMVQAVIQPPDGLGAVPWKIELQPGVPVKGPDLRFIVPQTDAHYLQIAVATEGETKLMRFVVNRS